MNIFSLVPIVCGLLFVGCNKQEGGVVKGSYCSLPEIGWRQLNDAPRNGMLVWILRPTGSRINVFRTNYFRDNHIDFSSNMSRNETINLLMQTKDFRPSPVIVMYLDRSSDCAEVYQLAEDVIDRVNDCQLNNCYYVAQ